MRRRNIFIIIALALGLLAAPLAVDAQPPKVVRIGMLWLVSSSPEHPLFHAVFDAFQQGLREQGYVAGRNVADAYPVDSTRPHG